MKIDKVLIYLVMVTSLVTAFVSCQKSADKNPSASGIISDYYKSKQIDTSAVLDEKHRLILDTVVIRLTETGEPEAVIQYIVNEYKLKYRK